jgi:hypothetical protein
MTSDDTQITLTVARLRALLAEAAVHGFMHSCEGHNAEWPFDYQIDEIREDLAGLKLAQMLSDLTP